MMSNLLIKINGKVLPTLDMFRNSRKSLSMVIFYVDIQKLFIETKFKIAMPCLTFNANFGFLKKVFLIPS